MDSAMEGGKESFIKEDSSYVVSGNATSKRGVNQLTLQNPRFLHGKCDSLARDLDLRLGGEADAIE